jgi:hypothetical protein
MRNVSICLKMSCAALLLSIGVAKAQVADSSITTTTTVTTVAPTPVPKMDEFKPSGHLWGYTFGDAFTKAHSDTLSRGGSNQYSGVPGNNIQGGGKTAFQFRRIYLGYVADISKKFTAELLLEAADNFASGNPPANGAAVTSAGDQTANGKLAFYIKLANLRWKNVWKGTDLVVGQVYTPSFGMLTEKIWSYRAVERTIADIRRTPSYDMGVTLQGKFDAKGNYGYNVMVGNGTSAKPAQNNFRSFYGDVYAKFLNQHLVFDLYADYTRENWVKTWHHSRQMLKGFVAYTTPKLTVGVEGFVNNLQKDLFATKTAGGAVDTLNNAATGLAIFVHGNIIKEKLRFFARVDFYNPMTKVNNGKYASYAGNTGNYNDNSFKTTVTTSAAGAITTTYASTGDETYKQTFVTAGLDYSPAKNVHFMPNVWFENYTSQLPGLTGKVKSDYDLVYRMTFYYIFGKSGRIANETFQP